MTTARIKTLRPYQEQARKWVNSQLNQHTNCLLVMPAGSGKTVTACNIIRDRITLMNKKLLVLCGTEEIFDQWVGQCSELDINYGYINPDGVIGRNKDVYICMWQTLSRILDILPEKFCNQIKEIITDECHHAAANTIESIYNHFGTCTLCGLTATPYRMDNKPLGAYFKTMFEPITQQEAIRQGFLCPPVFYVPEIYEPVIPDGSEAEAINKAEQMKFIKQKKIIGDMIGTYNDIFNGALCMIPCSSLELASDVAKMYRAQGWKVEFLSGTMNKTERKKIIRDARAGKINIITTYAVGTEGLDIPNIAGIIWMQFTESLVRWIQLNTRAARMMLGKKYYIIVDPVGNSVIHGSPAINRHWKLHSDYIPGEDTKDVPPMTICPVCGTANSYENERCWICGYDFILKPPVDKKERKKPKFVKGELVWLNDAERLAYDEIIDENDRKESAYTEEPDSSPISREKKIEILSRNLTGLKNKNKFREGVKWL